MTKKKRPVQSTSTDTRTLLRFKGGLIVDPKRCPQGIHAFPHWIPITTPVPAGEPNAECACPKENP